MIARTLNAKWSAEPIQDDSMPRDDVESLKYMLAMLADLYLDTHILCTCLRIPRLTKYIFKVRCAFTANKITVSFEIPTKRRLKKSGKFIRKIIVIVCVSCVIQSF